MRVLPASARAVEQLYVNSGRLNCPAAGDSSVEVCLGCPRLVSAELHPGYTGSIRCESRRLPLEYERAGASLRD